MKQNNTSNQLKPCPCGKMPERLQITEGSTMKYAFVSGVCCGEWNIEFRTNYLTAEAPECMNLAIKAWNRSPRK